jgi:hypothetical protein
MKFILADIGLILLLFCALQTSAQRRQERERMERYGMVIDASELKAGESPEEKIRKNFFLRAEVSKTSCFVGEPLMAVFKAYSRVDANSQVVKRPSLAGFSVIEMVDAYNNQPDIEKYNNEYYYVHLIRKVQLFPLQPGDFTLEPAEVESVIQLRSADENNTRLRLRNLFRRHRSNPELQRQMVFKTPEVPIHVNQLPLEGQPPDFSGAVGSFSIELSMPEPNAIQHEPFRVLLKISGTGNFPLITDPPVQWPEGVEVSTPVVNEDVNKYQFPLSGAKIFEYTITNSDTGSLIIPAVHFDYFDPASATYKKATSDTLTYKVVESDVDEKTVPLINVNRDGGLPLHFYYFGIVALVIVAVIVYISLKKAKR